MKLHDLRPAPGANKKSKRIGRGHGSGKGKTGGKGMMGQKARSGPPRPYAHFEGGQNPLVQRLPHTRGFTNIHRIEYTEVNLEKLAGWQGGEVTPESLRAAGIIKSRTKPVKILGEGEVDRALTIRTHKISAGAREKVEAAGGSVELIDMGPRQRRSRGRKRNK
ncbi:MAG: 50S ribosomal protein L15 [Herpetosiphonaceae bacterium]|nr:MAG: 50S ribosomal protein L15 [Herpetosiphonaceae bacterium]